jgi:hypothetical protein
MWLSPSRFPGIPWEIIQHSTAELQGRARQQGMADAVFDSQVHAAMLLEQAVDMHKAQQKRR